MKNIEAGNGSVLLKKCLTLNVFCKIHKKTPAPESLFLKSQARGL